MTVIGIDPGPVESAYAVFDGEKVLRSETRRNGELMLVLPTLIESYKPALVGIEMIASYGMAVGAEVFETCVQIGRFLEFLDTWNRNTGNDPVTYERYTRIKVKTHICHSAKAKDANVRQALIDRIGPSHTTVEEPRFSKKGDPLKPATVKIPGPTYGVSGDGWAALAVAVMAWDKVERKC